MKWKTLFLPVLILLIFIVVGINVFFNNRNKKIVEIEKNNEIVGIVLPHHNVMAKKRLEFLHLIATKKENVKKIILISPDHFSYEFQKEISCCDRNWELSNGNLEYDRQLGGIICDGYEFRNELIRNDHGIYNILPDIKNIWSNVKVVTMLIGQKMEFEKLNDLVYRINQKCGEDCLLIASVDFSHYLPYTLADIHDRKTERVLNNLEDFGMEDLEVDSPQSLYILTQLAKMNNVSWNKYFYSNSTKMERDKDKEGTSHFMGFYESEKLKTKNGKQNDDYTYCVGRFDEENLTIEELKEKNIESVGERFFYGVDYQDFSLEEELNLKEKIRFIPSEKVIFDKENNMIGLTCDLVVCGVLSEEPLFLPIKIEEDGRIFLKRGEERENFVREFDIVK